MATVNAVVESKGANNPEMIRNFVRGIILNPLYSDVAEDTKSKAGFVSKSLSVIEDKEKSYIHVEINFDSEENKLAYLDDPSTVSLWDMLSMIAAESGLDVKIDRNVKT